MVIPIAKNYDSEFDLYYSLIALYNVVEKWGLTETQMNILVYLIRFGYSKNTKEIICEKLKISDKSLTTNLSYLRQGKVGKKKIKKLLKTSQNNMNITLLNTELKDIKKLVESRDTVKSFVIDFGEEGFLLKVEKTIKDAITKKTTTSN